MVIFKAVLNFFLSNSALPHPILGMLRIIYHNMFSLQVYMITAMNIIVNGVTSQGRCKKHWRERKGIEPTGDMFNAPQRILSHVNCIRLVR